MKNGDRQLLRVKDAAQYLGMCEWTVYRYANKGLLPAKRVGSRWRFRKDELEQFVSGMVSSDDSGEGVGNAPVQTGNLRKN